MEKIKKALLQAREQREHAKPASINKIEDGKVSINDISPDETSEIYIREFVTKRIDSDVRTLEKNKILCSKSPLQAHRAYKMLRTRLLQNISKNNWNSIAIISPTSRDGKTLTAINLAISIAQDPNHTSLLIDFDFLQPSLYEYFDIDLDASVSDCIQNDLPLDKCLIKPGDEDFVMAPAKRLNSGTSEILASKSTASFTNEIKQKYHDRVILYDLPPILVCDDALTFLPNVDAALLILREGKTLRSDVEATMNILADKPLAGVVLNDSKYGISDYYY